jgi:hypothetical protein
MLNNNIPKAFFLQQFSEKGNQTVIVKLSIFEISCKKMKSYNHREHRGKAQRSQRNNNQRFTFVPSVGPLCPLWLK